MLQAQRQRKMAQKSTVQTPSASLPASAAPSEDGSMAQNGTTADASSTQVVPDTDSDSDMHHPSVAPAAHDSDTEVQVVTSCRLYCSGIHCCICLITLEPYSRRPVGGKVSPGPDRL